MHLFFSRDVKKLMRTCFYYVEKLFNLLKNLYSPSLKKGDVILYEVESGVSRNKPSGYEMA